MNRSITPNLILNKTWSSYEFMNSYPRKIGDRERKQGILYPHYEQPNKDKPTTKNVFHHVESFSHLPVISSYSSELEPSQTSTSRRFS
jgi:hypothetical protein